MHVVIMTVYAYLPVRPFPDDIVPMKDCQESKALLKESEVPSIIMVLGQFPHKLQQNP